ncbi:hypothetical protein [Mesobacillus subterraneus]|uniref:Uncharacterized protein n=1 Tax=Mesobacillus subterraneus TaxID=285983 RepID=A0A427TX21_9BACI|nr:hypothetical protein [Mesobacillus subterraneus]RSD29077.1 hypothetical protein EJA10_02930 [Mesobacillus subterraneus]
MRIIKPALAISVIIHLLYFIGILLYGYIQTKLYQPELNGWENLHFLQSEVAFGMTNAPVPIVFSVVIFSFIIALILRTINSVKEQ